MYIYYIKKTSVRLQTKTLVINYKKTKMDTYIIIRIPLEHRNGFEVASIDKAKFKKKYPEASFENLISTQVDGHELVLIYTGRDKYVPSKLVISNPNVT